MSGDVPTASMTILQLAHWLMANGASPRKSPNSYRKDELVAFVEAARSGVFPCRGCHRSIDTSETRPTRYKVCACGAVKPVYPTREFALDDLTGATMMDPENPFCWSEDALESAARTIPDPARIMKASRLHPSTAAGFVAQALAHGVIRDGERRPWEPPTVDDPRLRLPAAEIFTAEREMIATDDFKRGTEGYFSQVPTEVLALIFGFVRPSDRVWSILNVCKRWRMTGLMPGVVPAEVTERVEDPHKFDGFLSPEEMRAVAGAENPWPYLELRARAAVVRLYSPRCMGCFSVLAHTNCGGAFTDDPADAAFIPPEHRDTGEWCTYCLYTRVKGRVSAQYVSGVLGIPPSLLRDRETGEAGYDLKWAMLYGLHRPSKMSKAERFIRAAVDEAGSIPKLCEYIERWRSKSRVDAKAAIAAYKKVCSKPGMSALWTAIDGHVLRSTLSGFFQHLVELMKERGSMVSGTRQGQMLHRVYLETVRGEDTGISGLYPLVTDRKPPYLDTTKPDKGTPAYFMGVAFEQLAGYFVNMLDRHLPHYHPESAEAVELRLLVEMTTAVIRLARVIETAHERRLALAKFYVDHRITHGDIPVKLMTSDHPDVDERVPVVDYLSRWVNRPCPPEEPLEMLDFVVYDPDALTPALEFYGPLILAAVKKARD